MTARQTCRSQGQRDRTSVWDTILAPAVIPFINRRRRHTVFQQDNARPHTARLTRQFLTANNVDVMQWPAFSAELSPVEQIWDELDRRVRNRPNPPQTLAQLEQALNPGMA